MGSGAVLEPEETEPEFLPNRQVLEAVSWRVASELVRRHPRRLRVIETHPGGGQYDCLTLIDRRGWRGGHIDLNRIGTAHVHVRFDDPNRDGHHRYHGFWGAYLSEHPLEVLRMLERHAGLPDVGHLPTSTRTSLSFRFAASCMAPVALGLRRWEWRNGFDDNSGWESGVREDLFAAFPALAERRAVRLDGDPLSSEYRFWFLLREGEPLLALESVGLVWGSDRTAAVDLRDAYRRAGRRLAPLVNALVGPHLD